MSRGLEFLPLGRQEVVAEVFEHALTKSFRAEIPIASMPLPFDTQENNRVIWPGK
jgi:hypothetical protein